MKNKLGFKGKTIMGAGFVYAPYIPIYHTRRFNGTLDKQTQKDIKTILRSILGHLKGKGVDAEMRRYFIGGNALFIKHELLMYISGSRLMMTRKTRDNITVWDDNSVQLDLYRDSILEEIDKVISEWV